MTKASRRLLELPLFRYFFDFVAINIENQERRQPGPGTGTPGQLGAIDWRAWPIRENSGRDGRTGEGSA